MHDDGIMSLENADIGPVSEESDMMVATQDQEDEYKKYIDDVHGGLLDPAGVEAARREEIEWMAANGPTYRKVPAEEARGRKLVKTHWVDTNKGDRLRPDYRSRLCARETRRSGGCEGMEAQLFAATPPLEALRARLSQAMGRQKSKRGHPLKIGFVDVKKAHLLGLCKRKIFIELPWRITPRAWWAS